MLLQKKDDSFFFTDYSVGVFKKFKSNDGNNTLLAGTKSLETYSPYVRVYSRQFFEAVVIYF